MVVRLVKKIIENILSLSFVTPFFNQTYKCDDYAMSFLINDLKYSLYQHYEPGDDWTEHISSSGKKYYYNCRTEVSQWEKPKEWLER